MGDGADEFARQVRSAAQKGLLFLPHALQRMMQSDWMIEADEVQDVVSMGEIIEDYPEDARGHSCLLMGRCSSGRVIHVVCAPKPDYLSVISAYVPAPGKWDADYRVRRR
jgi:hypothetical protein